jgi:hypothetical protein
MIPSFPRFRCALFLVALAGATRVQAGKLDDLEKNATGNPGGSGGKTQTPYPGPGANSPDDNCHPKRETFLGALVEALIGPPDTTYGRGYRSADEVPVPASAEGTLLPPAHQVTPLGLEYSDSLYRSSPATGYNPLLKEPKGPSDGRFRAGAYRGVPEADSGDSTVASRTAPPPSTDCGESGWEERSNGGLLSATVRRATVVDEDEAGRGARNSRVDGDPDLPEFRLDLQGAGLDPSVRGSQVRFQFGFGPIAVQPDWLELTERGPGLPKLDRFTVQGLFRVSPTRRIEVDLGVGGTVLAGDHADGGWTFSLPVSYSPARWCALRWTPVVSFLGGDVLSDEELSVWWTHRYASAFAGWRWISAGNAQIDGPTVGISLSY